MTFRQLISDIFEAVKAHTLDDRISRRSVLSRLKNRAATLLKQDMDSRRVLKISEGWKRIPCVPLEEVDLMECALDVRHCTRLMKSRIKIPEVYQSSYGNILKIFTVDMAKEFKQTNFTEYKEIRRREWKNPNVLYFILLEGYLYLPDSEIEEVSALGLFKSPHEVTAIVEGESCQSLLDEEVSLPDYLREPIMQDIINEFLNRTKVPKDEQSNLNNNEK